jgi:hypothetical protein
VERVSQDHRSLQRERNVYENDAVLTMNEYLDQCCVWKSVSHRFRRPSCSITAQNDLIPRSWWLPTGGAIRAPVRRIGEKQNAALWSGDRRGKQKWNTDYIGCVATMALYTLIIRELKRAGMVITSCYSRDWLLIKIGPSNRLARALARRDVPDSLAIAEAF